MTDIVDAWFCLWAACLLAAAAVAMWILDMPGLAGTYVVLTAVPIVIWILANGYSELAELLETLRTDLEDNDT